VADELLARGDRVPDPVLPKRGRRRPNWFGWGLAAFILVSCLLFVDLHEVARELRRLDPAKILALVLISTADRLLMGYKWTLLLRIVGVHLPMGRVIRYFYQGSFTGLFLPSHIGGDILRAWWVSRDSGVRHPVYASLVVERLLGFASALNWAIVGAAVSLAYLRPQEMLLWVVGGVLGVVAGPDSVVPVGTPPSEEPGPLSDVVGPGSTTVSVGVVSAPVVPVSGAASCAQTSVPSTGPVVSTVSAPAHAADAEPSTADARVSPPSAESAAPAAKSVANVSAAATRFPRPRPARLVAGTRSGAAGFAGTGVLADVAAGSVWAPRPPRLQTWQPTSAAATTSFHARAHLPRGRLERVEGVCAIRKRGRRVRSARPANVTRPTL
jgi:hypothetical protein